MQGNKLEKLKKELVSIDFKDFDSNIINNNFLEYLSNQTIDFADFFHQKDETLIELVHKKKSTIEKLKNEHSCIRCLIVNNNNRYEDGDFLQDYANDLRHDLKLRYELNSNDINELNIILDKINSIYEDAQTLNNNFWLDFNSKQKGNISLDYRFNIEEWNAFLKHFGLKKTKKGVGGVRTYRATTIVNFKTDDGLISYATRDFLSDIKDLFYYRKSVLERIIKEVVNIEPKIVGSIQNAEYSGEVYFSKSIAIACEIMKNHRRDLNDISKGFNSNDESKRKQLENLIKDIFKISEITESRIYRDFKDSFNLKKNCKGNKHKNQVIELVGRTNNTKAIEETNKFYENK